MYETPLLCGLGLLLACCRVFGFVFKPKYWHLYGFGSSRQGRHNLVPMDAITPERTAASFEVEAEL